ncbi:MAG TPA: M48 family metalloprotease [Rhizomicrobium sp.]|nr:M48 family metalloprotease [Rhizomicrobium sp.]
MNRLRTGFSMAALAGLFLAAGFLIGGPKGAAAVALIAFAVWNADKVLLSMAGARAANDPRLIHLVQRLSARAGLPAPKLYIAENHRPNAFATGRDPAHAAICVTTGLLARLSGEDELAGVLAHELGHIRHRDTLPMTLARLALPAPLARSVGGRTCEREADRASAEISGNPLWLASALERVGTHPSTEERVARLRAMEAAG